MARRQGAARRGGTAAGLTPPLPVIVHNLAQARGALDLGHPVELVSARYLANFLGVGYLRAMEVELGTAVTIDCGDDAGILMAALRLGSRDFLFTGDERLRGPLAGMVASVGGRVSFTLERPPLVLEAHEDAAARLAGQRSGLP